MTQDKARKRAAHQRAAQTGESYTRAARLEAGETTPTSAADVAPLEIPAPVALMFSRHVRAAELHLGAAANLAADHGAPLRTPRFGDASPGPLYDARRKARDGLLDLHLWGERTAAASGAVPVAPGLLPDGEQEKAAERALYPAPDQWCQRAGGTLPQPGEQPDTDQDTLPPVRYSLPGPVPETRLRAHGSGRGVALAHDVVPGTPAAAVWDAHRSLYSYVCQWPERDGDSPADLAAAADGLTELADTMASAANAILHQAARRTRSGSLTGVDPRQLEAAQAQLAAVLSGHGEVYNALSDAMSALREALDGATAALPPSTGTAKLPAGLARQMAGKTTAELRTELGAETYWQRHRSKTRVPVYDKADAIQRMIQWCHAAGRDTYDPAAHASDDPGAR